MNLELYVVTDETISRARTHKDIALSSIAGGADVIQLRDKSCDCRSLFRVAQEIAALSRSTGTLFLVNDRLDIALACGAHGVHLGQGDISVDVARQLAPEGFIIGVSVGSVKEAEEAVQMGADYVALSPVFETDSKRDAGPGQGLSVLRDLCQRVPVPVIAIGGINKSNVREVIAAGADGVAVISAVASAPDVTKATRELKEIIRNAKRSRNNRF